MYNGIGLRTVRGSGTNGYVQRNLSYVNASRTRQRLVQNQRGGSSGDFGALGGGKNRLPPNAEILLHEKKRKVELHLLEMSLEMEERECDPEEIEDKVKRERERLLTRLHDGRDRGQEKTKDAESSHARQKRKEEENKRIKDAFGIASDYMVGESFDPEMQERRRKARKEKREQEGKERKERRDKNEKERREKEGEEARLLRLKTREEKDEKMDTRREPFYSRSRSRLVTRSRRSRPLTNRRAQGRDDAQLRKFPSRSSVMEQRSRRSSAPDKRKRSSLISSRSSSSSRSRSRSRNRKLQNEKCRGKDSQATKKAERTRSRSTSRSFSSLSSGSESDRSEQLSRKATVTKGKKLSLSVSPARSSVLKGKHKVLNLSKRSTPVCAVTTDESHENLDIKEEKRSVLLPEREKRAKQSSPVVAKREVKHVASCKQSVDEAKTSFPAVLPIRVKKEEKTEAPRSPHRSPCAVADSRPQSRKRKLRSTSPEDRRRRGRSTSSDSSKASFSQRRRCMRSRSAPSARSRYHSSDSSRSCSRSKPRSRRSNPRRRRGRSSSRSRSRGCGRSTFRSRHY